MKKTIFLLSCMFLGVIYSHAQQDVFKKYGHKKEILTLSKGKYQEVFKNSEVVQIGTVLLNTKTNKIIKLLQEDTTKTSYNAELSSRFLTIDPLAEKHPEISPYAFCNNNPVINIDPDGRDWFVNNESGNVIFIKGVSELNDDLRQQYNLGKSNYENLGKDNMFGDKVGYKWISNDGLKEVNNILDYNCATFDQLNSSIFMGIQGYEKAEKATIEESKITSTSFNMVGGDFMADVNFTLSVTDSRISYVKPNELNKISDQKVNTARGITTEIESTNYKLIKPYGQPYNKTYIYRTDQKTERISKTIETIGLIFSLFF